MEGNPEKIELTPELMQWDKKQRENYKIQVRHRSSCGISRKYDDNILSQLHADYDPMCLINHEELNISLFIFLHLSFTEFPNINIIGNFCIEEEETVQSLQKQTPILENVTIWKQYENVGHLHVRTIVRPLWFSLILY